MYRRVYSLSIISTSYRQTHRQADSEGERGGRERDTQRDGQRERERREREGERETDRQTDRQTGGGGGETETETEIGSKKYPGEEEGGMPGKGRWRTVARRLTFQSRPFVMLFNFLPPSPPPHSPPSFSQ